MEEEEEGGKKTQQPDECKQRANVAVGSLGVRVNTTAAEAHRESLSSCSIISFYLM